MAKHDLSPGTEALLRAMRSRGSKSASRGSDGEDVSEAIPTGIDVLDRWVLATGGLPVGYISEWYSAFGGGKTALGLRAVAGVQSAGGIAAWINAERAPIKERAGVMGVDTTNLVRAEPDSLEEALEDIDAAIDGMPKNVGPNLVVWDSVGALKPAAGRSKKKRADVGRMAETGLFAAIMTESFKHLTPKLKDKRVHLLCINQIRVKLGVLFGDNTTTPGGNAFHHYASHRVQILGGKAVKDKLGDHIAKDVTFLATKTRFSPPYRKCRARINFTIGWDDMWSTLEHCKNRKLMPDLKATGRESYLAALAVLGWPAPTPALMEDKLEHYEATAYMIKAAKEAGGWEEEDKEEDEEDEDGGEL